MALEAAIAFAKQTRIQRLGRKAILQPGRLLKSIFKQATPPNTTSPDGAEEFVSILMLTHGAPKLVETSIRTVKEKTRDVAFELVVLDNASDVETKRLLVDLVEEGLIDRLGLLDYNSLFSRGNNLAAGMANPKSTHFLLLNSDIEVMSSDWLRHLLDIHERGIAAYGWVRTVIPKVDGYCLLVDADLYKKHPLDERHQWWWAVTKLQAMLLSEGLTVKGYAEHERWLHHVGGGSGDGYKNALGMNVSFEMEQSWFGDNRPIAL